MKHTLAIALVALTLCSSATSQRLMGIAPGRRVAPHAIKQARLSPYAPLRTTSGRTPLAQNASSDAYDIKQVTFGSTPHRVPAINNAGKIACCAYIGGHWQVYSGVPPVPATDSAWLSAVTSGSNDCLYPDLSDSDLIYTKYDTGGPWGVQIIKHPDTVVQFSSVDQYSGQQRNAGQQAGIASDGNIISYYDWYGGGQRRMSTSHVGDFMSGGQKRDMAPFDYPDVNNQGIIVYTDKLKVYRATETSPLSMTYVDAGTMPRIADGGDPEIVYIQNGAVKSSRYGVVANGTWADVNTSGTIVFESGDPTTRLYQIFTATPKRRITIRWLTKNRRERYHARYEGAEYRGWVTTLTGTLSYMPDAADGTPVLQTMDCFSAQDVLADGDYHGEKDEKWLRDPTHPPSLWYWVKRQRVWLADAPPDRTHKLSPYFIHNFERGSDPSRKQEDYALGLPADAKPWTTGCIVVEGQEAVDKLYEFVGTGCDVRIVSEYATEAGNGYSISGTVRGYADSGVPGAQVVLKHDGTVVATTSTNASGSYIFTDLDGLVPSSVPYTIVVSADAPAPSQFWGLWRGWRLPWLASDYYASGTVNFTGWPPDCYGVDFTPKSAPLLSILSAACELGVTAALKAVLLGGTALPNGTMTPASGSGLAGRVISFAVDDLPVGTAVTDAEGIASYSWPIPLWLGVGVHDLTATYDGSGDATYCTTSQSLDALSVAKAVPSLTLAEVTGVCGGSTALKAALLCGTTKLVGRTLSFAVDGSAVGSAVTDANGVATYTWSIPLLVGAGTHDVTASYDGSADPTYSSTSRTESVLTLNAAPVVFSLYAASGSPGKSVTLKTLVYGGGKPVSGLTVQFAVDGTSVGSAVSDASGAALPYTIPATLSAGVHSVTVSFAGDTIYGAVTRTAAVLTVCVNTSFSLYSVSGSPGQTVVLKALVYSGGSPAAGMTVQFSVDGTSVGSAVSDASGAARSYVIPVTMAIGAHSVTVAYAGDATHYAATRTTACLDVIAPKASVAFSLYAASGTRGQSVALKALLVCGAYKVATRTVSFAVDGVSAGTTTTDADGNARVNYTIPAGLALGAHNVTATFGGDNIYNGTSRTAAVLTVKSSSVLSLYSTVGTLGGGTNLRCIFYAGNARIAGKTVWFSVDGTSVGSAVTAADGVASRSWAIPVTLGAGTHSLAAAFAGDADYAATTRTGSVITIYKANTAFSMYASSGVRGGATTLRAILLSGSTRVVGRSVAFAVDGAPAGTGTTDPSGLAACSYPIDPAMATGPHSVTATFDGSTDAVYDGSTRTASVLTVNRLGTTLSLSAVAGSVGQSVTLKAVLVSGSTRLPGQTVSFAVDGVPAGSGVTDANGVVSVAYTLPALSAGAHNVTASFAGDATYAASSRTAAVLTVK